MSTCPDMATSHNAKTIVDFMNAKNVNFMKKEDNTINIPEIRPIEDFWGILKGKVYESSWLATNFNQLRKQNKVLLWKTGL